MNDLALNVAIEVISAAVLLVVIVSQWVSANRRSKANRYFLAVLCLLFATLVVDIMAWLVDEKPGAFYIALAHTTNFVAYTTSILVNYFLCAVHWGKRPVNRALKDVCLRWGRGGHRLFRDFDYCDPV